VPQSGLTLILHLIPPFRLDLTVWALRRRPRNAIDRSDGSTYRCVILVGDVPTELAVRQVGAIAVPTLIVTATPSFRAPSQRRGVRSLVGRLLGVRIDLTDWYRTAAAMRDWSRSPAGSWA
jgi:DNA-3-methyladenine glycosylase II